VSRIVFFKVGKLVVNFLGIVSNLQIDHDKHYADFLEKLWSTGPYVFRTFHNQDTFYPPMSYALGITVVVSPFM